MFEQVTPSVRVAKAGTGIGVVTHGDRALLVDSGAGRAAARPRLARFARFGLDENLARKVVNALANEGVTVAAIVNSDTSLRDRALARPRVLARGALPRPLRGRRPFPRATHAHADHIGAGRVPSGPLASLARVRASWSEPRYDGGVR